jgi:hypothetical protein
MNDGAEYHLVNLDSSSAEFQDVVNDFKQKLGQNSTQIKKVLYLFFNGWLIKFLKKNDPNFIFISSNEYKIQVCTGIIRFIKPILRRKTGMIRTKSICFTEQLIVQ